MPIKKTTRRRPPLSDHLRTYLLTGEISDHKTDPDVFTFRFALSDVEQQQVWMQHRDVILADFIDQHPGRRPWAWWRWDAPRRPIGIYPGVFYDGKLPVPRERVGGTGKTICEKYPVMVPSFRFGVPQSWYTYDPDDPPCFEAEASYLLRHGLLDGSEEKRLNDEDYKPERIVDILMEEDEDD